MLKLTSYCDPLRTLFFSQHKIILVFYIVMYHYYTTLFLICDTGSSILIVISVVSIGCSSLSLFCSMFVVASVSKLFARFTFPNYYVVLKSPYYAGTVMVLRCTRVLELVMCYVSDFQLSFYGEVLSNRVTCQQYGYTISWRFARV